MAEVTDAEEQFVGVAHQGFLFAEIVAEFGDAVLFVLVVLLTGE